MTDQIPADKVRTILDEWERIKEHADWDDIDNLVKDIRALLPAPPRPSLADMTAEERAACQWMQCDVETWGRAVIVLPNERDRHAMTLNRRGYVAYEDHDTITPLPDLPRLEWPGDTPTGPDHLAVGTVIESADDPRIDALPVGSILIDRHEDATTKGRGDWTGAGYVPIPSEGDKYGPWKVLHIPKENPND